MKLPKYLSLSTDLIEDMGDSLINNKESKRKNFHVRKLNCIIFFCLFIGISLLLIFGSKTTIADGTGEYPAPDNGDWVITSYTKVWNETINLTGNLTIKNDGKLIFNNVTLIMNCSKDGEFSINVENGGEFYIRDNDYNKITVDDSSKIKKNNSNFVFNVNSGAILEIVNSELNDCGYDESNPGLLLESDNVKIENSILSNNYYGIFCESSKPDIINSTFDANYIGMGVSDCNMDIINCTITNSINFDFSLDLNSKVILLNTTFNKIKEIDFKDLNSEITFKWFLGVKVIDQGGKPIEKANTRIQDNENGTYDNNFISDENGNVLWILCVEYTESLSSKVYYTPYTITSSMEEVVNKGEVFLNLSEVIVIDLLIFNEDWIVNSLETYTNLTIILNANLSVENNGELKFNNVELIVNCFSDGEFIIEVKNGGKFNINDNDNNKVTTNDASIIRSDQEDYEYLFYVRNGAFFELKNSKLQDCGYDNNNPGLMIFSNDVWIENNTLNYNFYGIYLNNSNPTIKSNIIINNDVYGIFCEQSNAKIINNEISNNNLGINITENSGGNLEKNKIFENNEHGIVCYQNSKPLIFDNQIYENGKDGISTYFISTTLNIVNSTITDNERFGVFAKNSMINVDNSTITGSVVYDFYLVDSSQINVINSTFGKQNVDVYDQLSKFSIFWYAFVRVIDEDENRIGKANLRMRDNENGDFDKNYTSDLKGIVKWIEILEYIQYDLDKKLFTPYFFNATYLDKNGTLSNEIDRFIIFNIIIPLKDYTPPVILNYEIVNITQNSAIVRWITDEPSDSLLKYTNDSSLDIIEWDWEQNLTFTQNHEFILKNLFDETKYSFHLNSTDFNGNTIESEKYDFMTLAIPEPELEVKIEFLDDYFISNTSGYKINFRVTSKSEKISGVNLEYGSIINGKVERLNKGNLKTDDDGFRQVIYKAHAHKEDTLLTIWVNASADGYQFNNDTRRNILIKVIKVSKFSLQDSLPNNTKITVMAGYIGEGVLNCSVITNPDKYDYKNIDVFFDVNFTGENFFWFNITVNYDENLLPENIKEYNLRLYRWNFTNQSWQWEIVQKGGVNEDHNYVWANLTDLSKFTIRDDEAEQIVEPPPEYPDINLLKLEFSKTRPDIGDIILINLTMRNDGQADAENFKIKFYLDKTEIEVRDISLLKKRQNTTILIEWTAVKGEYNIIAKVENLDNDTDLTNNEISKSIKIDEEKTTENSGGTNMIIIAPVIGIVVVVIVLLVFKFDILGRYEEEEEEDEEEIEDDEDTEEDEEEDEEETDDEDEEETD